MSDESQGGGGVPTPLPPDPEAFREIAQHFFQQFLELKVQISQGFVTPATLEKEVQAERRKGIELKRQLGEIAGRNEALELTLERMESDLADLRRRLNETLFEVAKYQDLAGKKPGDGTGSLFYDRLSDSSKREWEKLMKERPRPGHE